MTLPTTAGIVGLGLIGGSIARDLAALGVSVRGYDRDPDSVKRARGEGVVDEALDASLSGLRDVELVIVAVPVSDVAKVLASIPENGKARVITDVGSTKRSAIAAAEKLGLADRFVGSHPMAGDHRSGWAAARNGLFHGARVYLCRTSATQPESLALMHELWRAIGARPEEITSEAHDRLMAYGSHLPHVAAAALARALADAGLARDALGPGGRDATRLAGGSVEMWTAIATDNASHLLSALTAMETQVAGLREALESHDERALREFFAGARRWFDSGAGH